jgi:hypothetical protein
MLGRNVVTSAPMTAQKGIIGYEDFERRMRCTYAIIYPYMYFWRVLKSTTDWAFIVVPHLRSLSRSSTKYMKIYYVYFGFQRSGDNGTKRQSTNRLHVCSHLEKRAAATSVINIFTPMRGDQPLMDVQLAPLSTLQRWTRRYRRWKSLVGFLL